MNFKEINILLIEKSTSTSRDLEGMRYIIYIIDHINHSFYIIFLNNSLIQFYYNFNFEKSFQQKIIAIRDIKEN